MSRIGKQPITVPAGVDVKVKGSTVKVKGPKGELAHTFPAAMKVKVKDGVVTVTRPSDQKEHRALHGMTRALINNMVTGVSAGYSKGLEIEGVGYRPELAGQTLVLHVGYSHAVEIEPPGGIAFQGENRGRAITIRGYAKQAGGQIAASIQKCRPPEPEWDRARPGPA